MQNWQSFDEDQERKRREELEQLPVYKRAFYQPFETIIGLLFMFLIVSFIAIRFAVRTI